MGLNASAQLIVGVHLELKKEIKEVRKYNEDTGKPYIMNKRNEFWVIAGTQTRLPNDESPGPLDIHYGDYANHHSYFLGTSVADTGSHRGGPLWASVEHLDVAKNRAADALESMYGYTGPIGTFVLCELSH